MWLLRALLASDTFLSVKNPYSAFLQSAWVKDEVQGQKEMAWNHLGGDFFFTCIADRPHESQGSINSGNFLVSETVAFSWSRFWCLLHSCTSRAILLKSLKLLQGLPGRIQFFEFCCEQPLEGGGRGETAKREPDLSPPFHVANRDVLHPVRHGLTNGRAARARRCWQLSTGRDERESCQIRYILNATYLASQGSSRPHSGLPVAQGTACFNTFSRQCFLGGGEPVSSEAVELSQSPQQSKITSLWSC